MAGKPLLFFYLNFIYLINVLIKAQPDPLYHFCQNATTYSPNSRYDTNLDTAISSLPNTNSGYGFYNFSVGQGVDTANAIALCRGDVDLGVCRTCLNDSIVRLRQDCPNQREASIYYDYCFLRYSNATILGNNDMNKDVFYMWNVNNASNKAEFNGDLRPLMDKLRGDAAAGNSLLKFAVDNTSGPDFATIYGLAQCIPNLSGQQCNDCLESAINQIPSCCDGKVGGRVLTASCNIRFEIYRFANNTPLSAPPPSQPSPPPPGLQSPLVVSPPPGKNTSKTRTRRMVIIMVVCFTVTIISLGIFIVLRKKKPVIEEYDGEIMDLSRDESLHYNFRTIRAATNDFSENNKLGQGGFGPVYKGELLDGQAIAVKRLSKNSGQGELEFKNEVLLLAKLQHRNLVKLLGFALEGIERLLIYEFVPNGSLDQYIFDPTKRMLLDWDTRYTIIGGVARGILYLHEDSRLRIIHRDLKAGNVLLGSKMEPKIADFGMARLFNQEEMEGNTNRIVGTFGYMSPEYATHGQFSVKSDVFSFGVLVLEMVIGQKNQHFRIGKSIEGLLSYAWKSLRYGTISDIIDPTLKTESGSMAEIVRCIHIGLLCVQNNVVDRPTMAEVVLMLKSFSLALSIPSEPAFYMHSSVDAEMPNHLDHITSGNVEGSQFSVNDVSVTEIVPR